MSGPATVPPFVLAFGDSLTAGYGLAHEQAFPAQLERRLRVRWPEAHVRNAGVSGDTTGSGLARLPRLLSGLRERPDLAIVELGANDLLRFVDADTTRRNLGGILDRFAECGIPVLLAGMVAPLFLGPIAARFNAIFPEIAAQRAVPLYPFFLDGATGRADLTLADGLHPNAHAITIVADRILPSVVAAIEGRTAAAA